MVRQKLLKEVEAGRMKGQSEFSHFENFRVSHIGVVPKKEPNEFRIIHHLSFTFDNSLNE